MPQEPHWLSILFHLVGGFLLLFKGAEWMVDGSARLARRIGVSVLVIGLTIVAFGTSAPEIVVSTIAAHDGNADLSLGNVLGSNVANIGLVLGCCALVLPSVMETRIGVREAFWLFGSLALFGWAASDRAITRPEAWLLLAVFAAYNAWLLFAPRSPLPEGGIPERALRSLLLALIGIAGIGIGAQLVVDGALAGAARMNLPASVVGLTMVAVGTSLPELAAGLGAALKGEKDISLGNVVGSNVFNVLAVVGIVAVVQPLDPAHFAPDRADELEQAFRWTMHEDLWVVLGFSAVAVALPLLAPGRLGRLKGGVLLAAYVAYVAWLCVTR